MDKKRIAIFRKKKFAYFDYNQDSIGVVPEQASSYFSRFYLVSVAEQFNLPHLVKPPKSDFLLVRHTLIHHISI